MTGTDVTTDDAIQSWCRTLFEEAMFRAATQVGRGEVGADRSVSVSLPVEVRVDEQAGELTLTLDSIPDGRVTLRLARPFDVLGTR
jgi:hypothetical protein